jgi:hypothetical protein
VKKNVDAVEAARVLGMKPEEIVAVDGPVVVLHDGTRFEVDIEAGTYAPVEAPLDVDADDAPRGAEHPAETAGTTQSALQKATDGDRGAAEDALTHPFAPPAEGEPPTVSDPTTPTRVQAPEGTTPVEVSSDDVVPTGTPREVLAWVGADQDRARRAAEVERARPAQRKSLLADLEKLAR